MTFTITPIAVDAGYGEAILSLADAKAHLRVEQDDADEDDLIGQLRDAAVDYVEQYTNVRLARVRGQAIIHADPRPCGVRLGIGPDSAFEVTAMSYPDLSGEAMPLPPGSWIVDHRGCAHVVSSAALPLDRLPITMTFEVGYPAGTCPPSLVAAVKLVLGHLYRNRETVITGTIATQLPMGAQALCDRYRMPVL